MDGISPEKSSISRIQPPPPSKRPEARKNSPRGEAEEDAVTVSLQNAAADSSSESKPSSAAQTEAAEAERSASSSETTDSEESLTEEEKKQVQELQERDREVRAHEQAHLTALGPYSQGGASFTFETGPDGNRYAVGGEVSVDVSPESEPEETVRKAETIKRAALAPAKPSGQDRAVAAKATQMGAEARSELVEETAETQPTVSIQGEKDTASPEQNAKTIEAAENISQTSSGAGAGAQKLKAYTPFSAVA